MNKIIIGVLLSIPFIFTIDSINAAAKCRLVLSIGGNNTTTGCTALGLPLTGYQKVTTKKDGISSTSFNEDKDCTLTTTSYNSSIQAYSDSMCTQTIGGPFESPATYFTAS
jgi:hypothetical protein